MAAPDAPEPRAEPSDRVFLERLRKSPPRRVLSDQEAAQAAGHVRDERRIEKNSFPYPERELDYTANVLNAKAREFYRRHGVTRIEPAVETGSEMKGRRLMTMNYCLRPGLGSCPGTEPLYLEDGEGHRFRLEFDCSLCRMALYLE